MAAYPAYTIGRVLEYGDDEDVAWLRTNFPAVEITEVVRNERRLSRRSATFWALLYGIPARSSVRKSLATDVIQLGRTNDVAKGRSHLADADILEIDRVLDAFPNEILNHRLTTHASSHSPNIASISFSST